MHQHDQPKLQQALEDKKFKSSSKLGGDGKSKNREVGHPEGESPAAARMTVFLQISFEWVMLFLLLGTHDQKRTT